MNTPMYQFWQLSRANLVLIRTISFFSFNMTSHLFALSLYVFDLDELFDDLSVILSHLVVFKYVLDSLSSKFKQID